MLENSVARTTIRIIIYVLLATLPAALTTATANATEIKSTVVNLAVLAVITVWVLRMRIEGRFRRSKMPLDKVIAAFLIWNVVCALVAHYRYATVPQAVRILGWAAIYYAIAYYLSQKRYLAWAIGILVAASIFPCVYGLLQHFRIDPIDWVPSSHERVLATFGNPTYFGAYLALVIPITWAAYLSEDRGGVRYCCLALVAMQTACILWTFSRGPWLGVIVGLAVGLGLPAALGGREFINRHWGRLAVAGLVLLPIAIWPSSQSGIIERAASAANVKDASNVQRMLQWRAAFAVFLDHPVTGVGPGALKIYMSDKLTPAFFKSGIETVSEHAHNELIEIAADTGVVGLALFIWLIIEAIRMTVRTIRQSDERDYRTRLCAGMLLGGIMGLVICNLAGVTMRYSCGAAYFWIYLGLLTATGVSLREESSEESEVVGVPVLTAISRVRFTRLALISAAVAGWFAVRPFVASMREKDVNLYLNQGDAVKSEAAIDRCLELSPYNVSVLYKLASLQNATSRCKEAMDTYKRIQNLSPGYGRIHYNLGVVYTNLGELGIAAKELERAALRDGLPQSWRRLSETYRSLGNAEKATWALAKSVEGAQTQGWRQQLELAEQLMKARQPAKAEKLLRAVVDYDPNLPRPRMNLALVCEDLGKTDEAAEQYRRVLALDPRNVLARTNLGCIYYRTGRISDARYQFERAAKTKGGVEITADLGLVYWRMGESKRALKMCESVLKTDPDGDAADRARAIIFRITGEKRL